MKYRVPCPNCGSLQTDYVDLRDINGEVAVMCWSECGMDFHVTGIWFMLNRLNIPDYE